MNNLMIRLSFSAFLLLLATPVLSRASSANAFKRYQSGKYESALREYKRLLLDKPEDARLHFNAGAAAFQVNDFDEALKQLNAALVTQDLQLQERAYYNLGNTEYRTGAESQAPDKKQSNWERAISSYESALKLDPKDQDAKFNLELVKKKLEELEKQQQQQKQDQSKDKQDQSKQDQQSKEDKEKQQQEQNKQDQSKQQEKDKQEQQKKQQEQNQENQKPEDQQAQQKPDPSKAEKKQAESQQGKESKDDQDKPEDQQAQTGKAVLAQMTPQQAQQLLDAQKNEEKPMIFIPKLKTNRLDRAFKDW